MGELLRQYGPGVLAWVLFGSRLVSRRRDEDRGRRCVRWVLLGLAVSLTTLSPAVYRAIERLTGVDDLARLVGHGSMLFVVWAAHELLAHLNGMGRGARWHAWWTGTAFAAMCALFAVAPSMSVHSPGVLAYCVVYLAGQAPALGMVLRLGVRYARTTRDRAIRASLHLVVVGTAAGLVYLVHKVARTAAARLDVAYPPDRTQLVGHLLPPAAYALILVGAALPPVLGWLHRYRRYQRLGPLWRALYRADPAIALDPPVVPDVLAVTGLRLRLYRRVIEIRDGLLTCHPYRDPAIAAAARDQGRRAGLRGDRLDASVEAAVIAAALRSRADGRPRVARARNPVAGGGDLDSDAVFLSRVADAFRAAVSVRPARAIRRRVAGHAGG